MRAQESDPDYFVVGLASFLIGHLLYIAGFMVGEPLVKSIHVAVPIYGCMSAMVLRPPALV